MTVPDVAACGQRREGGFANGGRNASGILEVPLLPVHLHLFERW